MKRILLVCMALSGCSTGQQVVTQRVQVPVPIPCKVEIPKQPAYAVDSLPIGSSVPHQMKSLRAERLQRRAYEESLRAALLSCEN